MTEKLLSDDEVVRLAGPDSKVMLYPDLQQYQNINQLFGRKKKIIILYLNEKTPDSVVGHWTLLTKQRRGGKEILEFADSYGGEIDSQLEYHNKSKRKQLDQEHGFLSRLLFNHMNGKEDKIELHYNEVPLQKSKENINTCGRWVGVRGHFYDIPLEKYQSIFKKLKTEGYDLDEVITHLSDKLLQ
jgi:hypothetical protein